MKHVAFFAVFGMSISMAAAPTLAQAAPEPPASAKATHQAGDQVLDASVGLFGFAGAYGNTTVPPLSLGYDYQLNSHISVGGLLGYAQSSYDFGFGPYGGTFTYTYVLVGATGTYHFDDLVQEALKGVPLDPYARLVLGYNVVSASYSGYGSIAGSGSYLLLGTSLGARYWFTPKLAGQLELGYGIGLLSLGVAYKI